MSELLVCVLGCVLAALMAAVSTMRCCNQRKQAFQDHHRAGRPSCGYADPCIVQQGQSPQARCRLCG